MTELLREKMVSDAIRIIHAIIRKEEARQVGLTRSTSAKSNRDRLSSYSRSSALQRAEYSLDRYYRSIK